MTDNAMAEPRRPRRGAAAWLSRLGRTSTLAVLLTVLALAAGMATYAALTKNPPFGQDPDTVYILLNLDLIILLLLGTLIARRIVDLWVKRRRGLAGSRLHVRMVLLFSIVAVAPAILLAVFSTAFFYVGVRSWFSERVSTAINESQTVAEAYLAEHQRTLAADALAMANDLNREAPRLVNDEQFFNQLVNTQAALRGLTEALVFDGGGRTLARSSLTFALQFEPIAQELLEQARQNDVVWLDPDSDDRVRALVQLDRFIDTYLLVGRLIEPRVIAHMERVQGAVAEYRQLESRHASLQITITLIYVVAALLLLLGAVWVGLVFSDRLITPISNLIGAAERVRAGDLSVRVPAQEKGDELDNLGRAFNRMTSQLESQRRELIEANRQLDSRRRFTETVLAGVSAGVIGIDAEGRINLPNKSAMTLLGLDFEGLMGRRLDELIPEVGELLTQIRQRPGRLVESQVRIQRGTEQRTLLVRIAAERFGSEVRGYVVTFDDITDLLSAQRMAAWADVARRIAHEIKNPLTPIQLSAERLKRKYLRQIETDPDTFVSCTDTIVRQVGDIGRMVDEFSAFARMPSPVMKPVDVHELCQQAVMLQRTARPDVEFVLDRPAIPPLIPGDRRQIGQAVTNLLQNALDAIEGRAAAGPEAGQGGELPKGRIALSIAVNERDVVLTVDDNGKGLPIEDRDKLTEPYVTTRAKGTGLGLAIVKKIMEDHGGRLSLEDRPGGGARVRLSFPRGEAGRGTADGAADLHESRVPA